MTKWNRNSCCPEPVKPDLTRVFSGIVVLLAIGMTAIGAGASAGQTGEVVAGDPAVGRLNHAGFKSRAHCTAFLMEDGAVISAAHCLPDISTDTVHVLLGYERGSVVRHIKTPANAYRVLQERDISALCRSEKLAHGFRPAALSLNIGLSVDVHGYSRPRVNVLQKTACAIKTLPRESIVTLDCTLPPGTSGAPVTVTGTRDIVGVVSATFPGGSLVSRITDQMLDRLCE
jgi:V8-like Glu-specific endopeptidase